VRGRGEGFFLFIKKLWRGVPGDGSKEKRKKVDSRFTGGENSARKREKQVPLTSTTLVREKGVPFSPKRKRMVAKRREASIFSAKKRRRRVPSIPKIFQ